MIRINLLPVRTSRKREAAQQQLIYLLLGTFLVAGVLVWVHMNITQEIEVMADENRQIKEEIERLKAVIGDVEKFEKEKESLQKKLDIIKDLKTRKTGPVHMLDEIATNIPEKCWLSSVAEVNHKVTLTGTAINSEVVADFMGKLEESGYFDDVILVSIQQKEKDGLKLKDFSITARVTTPEEKKQMPGGAPASGDTGGE